jgi:hypothetical protein
MGTLKNLLIDHLKMKIDYKNNILTFILTVFLFSGCYIGHIPTKVYKTPSKYGFDCMIPTYWDGEHPVRYWETTIKLGDEFTDFNGLTWVIEKHPNEEDKIIIKTDITK